jgi:DNA processing protein
VYALPGPVKSKLSEGCHLLIKQGAGILISPKDLLLELGICSKTASQNLTENKIVLESEENIVYSCLDLYPKGLQQLVEETGKSPERIVRDLISLELEGKVKEISKNHYVRTL